MSKTGSIKLILLFIMIILTLLQCGSDNKNLDQPHTKTVKPKNINESQFLKAVQKGNLEKIKELINSGADVNQKSELNGKTALHYVIEKNPSKINEIIQLLLSKGADVNLKSNLDMTPLHVAVYHGRRRIVELLLNKGADVSILDRAKNTPYQIAVSKEYKDIAKLLKGKK